MINSNRSQIDHLCNIISTQMTPLINNDFVLVDIPNHRNIGDSLIWKGELEYFKTLKYKCLRQFNRDTFKSSHIVSDDTVILLHGGGNFGDIYATSQDFKRYIIQSFPNNRIIIMPQTVYYRNDDNLKSDFIDFNKHRDLYIFVRDFHSFNMLSQYFDKERLLLVPDMAFFLNFDSQLVKKPSGKNLFLSRTDVEKVSNDGVDFGEDNLDIFDWPTYNSKSSLFNTFDNYIEALDGKVCKIIKNIPICNLLVDDAYGLKKRNGMDSNIDVGISFINKYDKVYTTRLHGLIMSVLLNKKVVVLDNSYGKNRGFYDAWLNDFNNIELK